MRHLVLPVALTLLPAVAMTQEQAGSVLGAQIRIETYFQDRPEEPLVTGSLPYRTVISDAVEFPNVASLEDPNVLPPPGFAGTLVNTSIDFGADWLEISFANIRRGEFQFAHGSQNTYVFIIGQDCLIAIAEPRIDRARSSLAIADAMVYAIDNRLHVNVSGLTFNATTRLRVDFGVVIPPVTPPASCVLS